LVLGTRFYYDSTFDFPRGTPVTSLEQELALPQPEVGKGCRGTLTNRNYLVKYTRCGSYCCFGRCDTLVESFVKYYMLVLDGFT
jgi:hypothetical protein